ncbi:MAG: adenylate/guanylate cyclase domain-containing protein, partial [Actinomycetota bacterium]
MSGTGSGTSHSVATESAAFVRSVVPHVLGANFIAAVIVYLYLALVSPPSATEENFALEIGTFGAYVLLAAVVGVRVGKRTFGPVAEWLNSARAPTHEELEHTLEQPLRQATWVLAAWCLGGLAFAVLHLTPVHYEPAYGAFIGAVSLLGGLAAAMLSYLVIEQRLKPIFARALAETTPLRPRTLGVRYRVIVSWGLGSAVVFVAIGLTTFSSPRLEQAIWVFVPLRLFGGGLIIAFAARSVAEPVTAMRSAVQRVEKGDFDARVAVDDGSEVGLLQAGFNRMAAGLQERERLRSIFGTYLDPEIADHILRTGPSLAGEEVEVTIMFLDIRDFTGFAERAPAQEVVATVNRLFERIVPIIHEHKGHVDKFVGDGVLAVFGAPRRQPNHADLALRAALGIESAVADEFQGRLEIGIGLNSGNVVVGNIGGGGRLEFSVIGDAVNVAARIEAATRATGDG